MMDTRDIALGYQANFVAIALVCLVNCLKNQGALGARQYEDALRATIEAGGPDRERLDYQLLANLLATLEKQEPGQPPKLDAIH